MLLSHGAFGFSVACFTIPNGLRRLVGNIKSWGDEAKPHHIGGAHPSMPCFIEAGKVMDIEKNISRSVTTIAATTKKVPFYSLTNPSLVCL